MPDVVVAIVFREKQSLSHSVSLQLLPNNGFLQKIVATVSFHMLQVHEILLSSLRAGKVTLGKVR